MSSKHSWALALIALTAAPGFAAAPGHFSKAAVASINQRMHAMVEAAPLLARDDDAGYMSKVALLTKPPAPKTDKKKDIE